MSSPRPKLTKAQRAALDALGSEKRVAFVLYLVGEAKWNAAEAARLAGYSEEAARQIAHDLLTNSDVAHAVELFKKPQRDRLVMGKREAQRTLTKMARADELDIVITKDGPLEAKPTHHTRINAIKTLSELRGWVTKKVDMKVTAQPASTDAARKQAEEIVAALGGTVEWHTAIGDGEGDE